MYLFPTDGLKHIPEVNPVLKNGPYGTKKEHIKISSLAASLGNFNLMNGLMNLFWTPFIHFLLNRLVPNLAGLQNMKRKKKIEHLSAERGMYSH